MFVIVSYDIKDDKRRNAVSDELLNFGKRVQKSVFECFLEEQQIVELKSRLELLIDPAEDHVRYYYLCKPDAESLDLEGKNIVYKDEDYFMV